MVYVTFEELKREIKHKVVTILCASAEFVTETSVSDAFEASDSLGELKLFTQRTYPSGDIPFLEVDRVEDQFLPNFLKELKNVVTKR